MVKTTTSRTQMATGTAAIG